MREITVRKLVNGLTVVAERVDYSRSVSAGFFVRAGSANEAAAENGLSHFLEHMLFKGTQSLSAKEISLRMDSIGANLNAYTSKEYTCYYAKTMDAHIGISLPLLADMIQHSLLDAQELKKESGVIIEEIAMVEDMPDDIVHDVLSKAQFGEHALGQTILGPPENIERFERDDLLRYMADLYYPANCVLAVAGNFEPEALFALCEAQFGGWDAQGEPRTREKAILRGDSLVREKDVEQVHLCIGYPGIEMGDEDIYAMNVFCNVFGSSMSSRLYQRIREEMGMAYSIYSYPSSYQGCGTFAVYVGTGDKTAVPVLRALREETRGILKNGLTDEELHWGREQLRGSFILSQESVSGRMMSIGRNMLLRGSIRTEDEVIERIDALTKDDVHRVMHAILEGTRATAAVGRITDDIQAELEMI